MKEVAPHHDFPCLFEIFVHKFVQLSCMFQRAHQMVVVGAAVAEEGQGLEVNLI